MKTTLLLFFTLTSILLMSRADAGAQGAIINWQGNGGYRARITMNYDTSLAVVSAQGGGPFGGASTNQGISSLSVQFFLPSSLTPIYSTQNISNSIVTYKFLGISFDTVSGNLIGSLDVGRDSFAEGDPGSSVGQYYLLGISSPSLINSGTAQQVDSGGQFTITIIPEPSTMALGVIGFAFLIARRLRPNHGAAANPAWRRGSQSARLVCRVAELDR